MRLSAATVLLAEHLPLALVMGDKVCVHKRGGELGGLPLPEACSTAYAVKRQALLVPPDKFSLRVASEHQQQASQFGRRVRW